jgi:broad specificity phosphatase PhoE
MENFKFKTEKKENNRKLLGTLILTRHSETKYTEKYPDLTRNGGKLAHLRGEEIGSRKKEEKKRYYVSSPQPRAVSTNDIIKHQMGDDEKEKTHISDQIRATDFFNREEANKWFEEMLKENLNNKENFGKAYAKDERFENRPDIVEPRSKLKTRAMRALEYLIKSFYKTKDEKPPCVVVTSHFEIINPIISQIFPEEEIIFDYVEDVEIEFYEKEESENILMKIKFREKEKEVEFNRRKREILI